MSTCMYGNHVSGSVSIIFFAHSFPSLGYFSSSLLDDFSANFQYLLIIVNEPTVKAFNQPENASAEQSRTQENLTPNPRAR